MRMLGFVSLSVPFCGLLRCLACCSCENLFSRLGAWQLGMRCFTAHGMLKLALDMETEAVTCAEDEFTRAARKAKMSCFSRLHGEDQSTPPVPAFSSAESR